MHTHTHKRIHTHHTHTHKMTDALMGRIHEYYSEDLAPEEQLQLMQRYLHLRRSLQVCVCVCVRVCMYVWVDGWMG